MKIYKHEPKHDRERCTDLNPYTWPILPIEDIDIPYFHNRFRISPHSACRYIKRTPWDCYLLPINKPSGPCPGYVMRKPWDAKDTGIEAPRKPWKDLGPKSVTYVHARTDFCAYYPPAIELSRAVPTVIVEDQISAIKCADQGFPAWALLGTYLDCNKVAAIQSLQPSKVIFALDPDATSNAFEMARQWGVAFDSARVAVLQKDLKDTLDRSIADILGVSL